MNHTSYPFKIHSIKIGTYQVRIAQLENPELLFDELLKNDSGHEDLQDERIPYWGELWPSSIALSEFLNENSELISGKKIIEIGCGLGLSGIVAAKLGGVVTLTDYLPAALEFASYNWKLNFSSDANVRILDWRSPGKISPVDVLIASDVAYESRAYNPLLKTMKSLLKKNGIVILSEPNREFTKEFINEFKKNNFIIKQETRIILKDGIKYKVTIYILNFYPTGSGFN